MRNDLEKRKKAFIEKAKTIHKNESIDYSLVDYVNNRTPVLLIDRDLKPNGEEYGEFWQTPSNHLKGQSHPDKRKIKISNSKSSKQEDIIERFKEVHLNENLDYSEVVYINMHTKVKIIDRDLKPNGEEYGEYWQEPVVHLKGCGHPLKSIHKNILRQSSNTKEFVQKIKLVHGDKYDYSKVEYLNNRTKVEIICPKHGIFLMTPDNLLKGKGCPKCGKHLSKNEDEIAEILSHYYQIERHNRTVLNGLELDIFIPSLNIGVEYNGLRWHSEKFKNKNYHIDKLNLCINKGIKLIQIFEDEYINNKELVLIKLLQIFNNKKSEY